MRRLPCLSRGQKTARNLLVTALALVFLWGLLDFPLVYPDLEFRRAAEDHWVEDAQYQGSWKTDHETWAVGTAGDQVLLNRGRSDFDYWPRNSEGTTLFPIQPWSFQGEGCIAAVDLPEGAEIAMLTAAISCWALPEEYGRVSAAGLESNTWTKHDAAPEYWTKTYTVEGRIDRAGGAFFPLEPEDSDPNSLEYWNVERSCDWSTYETAPEHRYVNCAMEAVFYDSSRNELGRAKLMTPD